MQDEKRRKAPMSQTRFPRKTFLPVLHLSLLLKGMVACLGAELIAWLPIPASAIVQHPTPSQILESITKGKEGAQNNLPPNMLYSRFGSSEEDSQSHGFLMTKLGGIAVMSSHFALRGEQPAPQDIQRILEEESLQVVVMMLGNSPTFAPDSYLLLKQESRVIKPDRIRFDAQASPIMRHGVPLFRAKIVASFLYGTFDLSAHTTIKVFPGAGGEQIFDVEFSAIP